LVMGTTAGGCRTSAARSCSRSCCGQRPRLQRCAYTDVSSGFGFWRYAQSPA
jgi:hypothetical protein